jgi:leader peptidase (prepilin peptidase)/N-methyltransferase
MPPREILDTINGPSFLFSPEHWFLLGSVFVLGACAGSFLNVCVWRIPRDESIVFTPSHCPSCGKNIPWFLNVPLVSWVVLGGKCHFCKAKISFRYFFVELLTAVLFALVFTKVAALGGPAALLPPLFAMTMLCVTTVFIDWEHRIIPDLTTYPVMITGLAFSLLFPEIWGCHSPLTALLRSFAGLAAGVLIFAAAAVIGKLILKKDAMGWGDVKFLGAAGACLGFRAVFFIVFFSCLTGALAGLLAVALKRKKLGEPIPFGPFLAVSAYIWILYDDRIMSFFHSVSKLIRSLLPGHY